MEDKKKMREVWNLMWLLGLLMAARRTRAQVLPEMDDLFLAAVKEGRAHSVHELLSVLTHMLALLLVLIHMLVVCLQYLFVVSSSPF